MPERNYWRDGYHSGYRQAAKEIVHLVSILIDRPQIWEDSDTDTVIRAMRDTIQQKVDKESELHDSR